LITTNPGPKQKFCLAKCPKTILGKSKLTHQFLTIRNSPLYPVTFFSDDENDPKIENVINSNKMATDAGKSSPEGHRSSIVEQEPHLTKPDHKKSLHVQSPILTNRKKFNSLQK